jgi:hypothetical protein
MNRETSNGLGLGKEKRRLASCLQPACRENRRRVELDKLDLIRVTVTGRNGTGGGGGEWGGTGTQKGEMQSRAAGQLFKPKKCRVIEERRICSVSNPNAPAQFLHYITAPPGGMGGETCDDTHQTNGGWRRP